MTNIIQIKRSISSGQVPSAWALTFVWELFVNTADEKLFVSKWDGTYYEVWAGGGGGLTINEATLSVPAKTNGRKTVNIVDASVLITNKIFVQTTLAGEENEEDETEIKIVSAVAKNGSFDVTFETIGFVFWEFTIYYLIA